MSGKKSLDISHPDFPKYKAEFDELAGKWKTEIAALPYGQPDSESKTVKTDKAFYAKLKKLQQKYAYLFLDQKSEQVP